MHLLTPVPQRQPARTGRRGRLSWLRGLPPLARPIIATMPWVTLLTGCLAGTGYLAITAHLAGAAHSPPGQGTVRLAFLPVIVALAFVPRARLRPLTQTTPVPVWLIQAAHLLLAAPILAVTCWAQLRIVTTARAFGHPPAIYPLIAQLTAWCAVTVAAAACTDRSRYADLGGAIAAPVGFAAIALAWYTPVTSRYLTAPPATQHAVAIIWYAITAAALALTCVAMRDRWHRHTRGLRWPPATTVTASEGRRPTCPGRVDDAE